jgi:hypothetical protein
MHEWISIAVAFALGIIALYLIFGRRAKLWRAGSALRGFLSIAAFFFLAWSANFVLGGGIMLLLPEYSEGSLVGLTPDQVIERLGPPWGGDPRKHGWEESRDGPLLFEYEWNWTSTTIQFRENQVEHVWRGSK